MLSSRQGCCPLRPLLALELHKADCGLGGAWAGRCVWLCHLWVLIGRVLHVTSEAAFVAVELLHVVTVGAVALVV